MRARKRHSTPPKASPDSTARQGAEAPLSDPSAGLQTHAVTVERVTKKFGQTIAVNDVSITIPRGEYLALLGPNGAGKTTLVEMIEGLTQPTGGRIEVLGQSWSHNAAQLRRRLGISLQETHFIDKLTVMETLLLFASFYRLPAARAHQVMSEVRLEGKAQGRTVSLSGGQKQRLALGVALLNKPELLILDEPTTGLDPHSRRELWAILNGLKKAGTTLILTTHYMEEAEYLCDRIVIMDRGRVLADGTLADLLDQMNKNAKVIIHFKGQADIQAVEEAAPEAEHPRQWTERSLTVETAQELEVLGRLTAAFQNMPNAQMLSFECRQMNLDDLFIHLAGHSLQSTGDGPAAMFQAGQHSNGV